MKFYKSGSDTLPARVKASAKSERNRSDDVSRREFLATATIFGATAATAYRPAAPAPISNVVSCNPHASSPTFYHALYICHNPLYVRQTIDGVPARQDRKQSFAAQQKFDAKGSFRNYAAHNTNDGYPAFSTGSRRHPHCAPHESSKSPDQPMLRDASTSAIASRPKTFNNLLGFEQGL